MTSSGFSLVILAAMTWPRGRGCMEGLEKSIGVSPQVSTSYSCLMSFRRYRGRPIAICNDKYRFSHQTILIYLSLKRTWIYSKNMYEPFEYLKILNSWNWICPVLYTSSFLTVNITWSWAAGRLISATISVHGCSTWRRGLSSRKWKVSVSSL